MGLNTKIYWLTDWLTDWLTVSRNVTLTFQAVVRWKSE
jgi:hypothetical protein